MSSFALHSVEIIDCKNNAIKQVEIFIFIFTWFKEIRIGVNHPMLILFPGTAK